MGLYGDEGYSTGTPFWGPPGEGIGCGTIITVGLIMTAIVCAIIYFNQDPKGKVDYEAIYEFFCVIFRAIAAFIGFIVILFVIITIFLVMISE